MLEGRVRFVEGELRLGSPSITCALPCSDTQFAGGVPTSKDRNCVLSSLCLLLVVDDTTSMSREATLSITRLRCTHAGCWQPLLSRQTKCLRSVHHSLCAQPLQVGMSSSPAHPSMHCLGQISLVAWEPASCLQISSSGGVQHHMIHNAHWLKGSVLAGELVAERERNRPAAKPNSADPRSPHRPPNSPYKGHIAVCLSPSAARSKAQTSAATRSAAAAAATLDNPQRPVADISAVHPVARTTASMQRVCNVAKYAPAFGHRFAQTQVLHAAWCQLYTCNTLQSCTLLKHTTL